MQEVATYTIIAVTVIAILWRIWHNIKHKGNKCNCGCSGSACCKSTCKNGKNHGHGN